MARSIEQRIADCRVEADILELSRKTEGLEICFEESDRSFSVRGTYNNFDFDYIIGEEAHFLRLGSDNNSANIDYGREGTDLEPRDITINGVRHVNLIIEQTRDDLLEMKERLEKGIHAPRDPNQSEENLAKQLSRGEDIDWSLVRGRKGDRLRLIQFAYRALRIVRGHSSSTCGQLFPIIDKYRLGEYAPDSGETPVGIRTNEEVIGSFDLSLKTEQ